MPVIRWLPVACAVSLLGAAVAWAQTALPEAGQQRSTAVESARDVRDSWQMCNSTNENKIWVAYSYVENKTWVTKGWRTIDKGKCVILVNPVENRYMYYYAQGLRQRWTGEKQSCVNPKDSFVLRADDCPKGYKMYPFKEVDAGDSVSLTTKLEE
jgi:uncharacterized membrane protein